MSARERKVGFVGLGNMGSAMVEAILKSGYWVAVYDVDPAAASALEPLGAQKAPGPRSLADQADVILTSLPEPELSETFTSGRRGLSRGRVPAPCSWS